MTPEQIFGRELRMLRRRNPNNVSLAEIADHTECSIAYISAIERGERNPPSNSKLLKILEFLGEEEHLPHLIDLAIKARKSIEIPIDGTSNKRTDVLLGLARRIEQGGLSNDDPFLDKLKGLLEEEDEK